MSEIDPGSKAAVVALLKNGVRFAGIVAVALGLAIILTIVTQPKDSPRVVSPAWFFHDTDDGNGEVCFGFSQDKIAIDCMPIARPSPDFPRDYKAEVAGIALFREFGRERAVEIVNERRAGELVSDIQGAIMIHVINAAADLKAD